MTKFHSNSVKNTGGFETDTIYQIVTDRFFSYKNTYHNKELCDKNSITKYHGGNWNGITTKINQGYFKKLGITALWISPTVENIEYQIFDKSLNNNKGGIVASYHGYYPKDFFRTNKHFGSWNDFKLLIKTAHENGLKIVIDFVVNHTSPLEKQIKHSGCLYKNGKLIANYFNDINGCFNHFGTMPSMNETIEESIYQNLSNLADLNQMNPIINKYLNDAVAKWIKTGVDGIRVDAISHVSKGWLNTWLFNIYKQKPIFAFGEFFSLNNWFVDSNNFYLYNANNMALSFLNYPLSNAYRGILSKDSNNLNWLVQVNEHQSKYTTVHDKLNFIDNHDVPRYLNINNNRKKLKAILVILMTSRGIPIIYYGTEQFKNGGYDPQNREDMDWTKPYDNKQFKLLNKLSQLRKQSKAIAYGSYHHLYVSNDTYIFVREFDNEIVIVAINLSNHEQLILLKNTFKLEDYAQNNVLLESSKLVINKKTLSLKLRSNSNNIWQFKNEHVKPKLLIGNITPSSIPINGNLTISGGGFGCKPGKVFINGTTIKKYLNWSDSLIQFKVPMCNIKKKSIIKVINNKHQHDTWINKIKFFSANQVLHRIIVKNVKTLLGQSLWIISNNKQIGTIESPQGPFLNKFVTNYPDWFLDINVPANQLLKIQFIILDINKKPIKISQTFSLKTNNRIDTKIFKKIIWKWMN